MLLRSMDVVRMGVGRGALIFLLIIKNMAGDLQVHFVPVVASSVSAFSTHRNGRLLAVRELCRLITVLLLTPSIIPHTHTEEYQYLA